MKQGNALDRRAKAGESRCAFGAVRAYEHGIRLLAAAEAAGVCKTQTLHALRPKMKQIDQRIALLAAQLDGDELRAAVDADAAAYLQRSFTVLLDSSGEEAEAERVVFEAVDLAGFGAALRPEAGGGAGRFEIYDEDLGEWYTPLALSDIPAQACRARALGGAPVPCSADSTGVSSTTESTQEEMVARQREQIAQLRGRLESLASTSPRAAKRQGSAALLLPEGVPPVACDGFTAVDTDAAGAGAAGVAAAAPSGGSRETALADVQQKRAALLDQTEDEDEANAKLKLVQAVDDWLTEVGIGGNLAGGGANRGFDPTALVQFGWEHMLEDRPTEDLYRLFVEAQQVAAQQSLWLQLMEGTELEHLAAMPAMDVEQFSLKSGTLEQETSKNKWSAVYAILWRNPAIAIDDTTELGLLLYPSEDSPSPSLVVQLTLGQFTVSPPKTNRQTWRSVFRLQAGSLKLILGAADVQDREDWVRITHHHLAFCAISYTKNDHCTKTGSGQT
jgi:hypothetical protein